jgi:hypothetical protein
MPDARRGRRPTASWSESRTSISIMRGPSSTAPSS